MTSHHTAVRQINGIAATAKAASAMAIASVIKTNAGGSAAASPVGRGSAINKDARVQHASIAQNNFQ